MCVAQVMSFMKDPGQRGSEDVIQSGLLLWVPCMGTREGLLSSLTAIFIFAQQKAEYDSHPCVDTSADDGDSSRAPKSSSVILPASSKVLFMWTLLPVAMMPQSPSHQLNSFIFKFFPFILSRKALNRHVPLWSHFPACLGHLFF